LRLEELTLHGFNRSAITLTNCTGEQDDRVICQRVRVTADATVKETAFILDGAGGGSQASGCRYILVRECLFDGPFNSIVQVAGPATYVDFVHNRVFNAKDVLVYKQPNPALRMVLDSNTFFSLTRSVVYFEANLVADNTSQLTLTRNLLAETSALVRADSSLNPTQARQLFARSSGNVCHEASCRKYGVAFLEARPLAFDLKELPLDPNAPNFLVYSSTSALTSAGPERRSVGMPPNALQGSTK
jgi:hypothetical protein